MKRKWESLFRALMVALLLVALWSVWRAAAQTNSALAVVEPGDGARFNPGSKIVFRAVTGAQAPTVRRVEFVVGGQVMASVTNAPFTFTWTNAPMGSYVVAARALTDAGSLVESEPIRIGVYSAFLTFGLNHVKVLNNYEIFDIELWQYCASLIYILLAFYVSKFLDFLTRVWLARWAAKAHARFDAVLLNRLKGPIKVVLFVALLRVGFELFSWPFEIRNAISKIFTVVISGALTYLAVKFIDLGMGYWRQRARPDGDRTFEEQLFPIISKSLKIFAVIVALLVTLENININITAVLTSLSIGGLAVGLAAQDTLANVFGAVAIFVDKPFRIGDDIKFEGFEGKVENIGLRSTRVRNPDGFLVAVPNKAMGNATVTNLSRRKNIRTEMNIGLTYETSVEKTRRALAIVEEIYRGHPMTADLLIGFNKMTSSGLNIWVLHWWQGTDFKAYLAGIQELNLEIKGRFDAEGIEFAYPSQTVYLKHEEKNRAD